LSRGFFILLQKTVTLSATTNSVSLCFHEARGMAFHTDPKRVAEIERLFVG